MIQDENSIISRSMLDFACDVQHGQPCARCDPVWFQLNLGTLSLLFYRMLDHFAPEVLPRFTADEQQLLKGSVDYLGINVYTSRYVSGGQADGMVSGIMCCVMSACCAAVHTELHV